MQSLGAPLRQMVRAGEMLGAILAHNSDKCLNRKSKPFTRRTGILPIVWRRVAASIRQIA